MTPSLITNTHCVDPHFYVDLFVLNGTDEARVLRTGTNEWSHIR